MQLHCAAVGSFGHEFQPYQSPVWPDQKMAPWRQSEGEESTTVQVGGLQKVVVLAEAMAVIPHRPLFAVQRCRMGNGDVVVVKCVFVGDLPVAGQAASALAQQGR